MKSKLHFLLKRNDALLFKYPTIWEYDFFRLWICLLISLLSSTMVVLIFTRYYSNIDLIEGILWHLFLTGFTISIAFEGRTVNTYLNHSKITFEEERLLKYLLLGTFAFYTFVTLMLKCFFVDRFLNIHLNWANNLYPAFFISISAIIYFTIFDHFYRHGDVLNKLLAKNLKKLEKLFPPKKKVSQKIVLAFIRFIAAFFYALIVMQYAFFVFYKMMKQMAKSFMFVFGFDLSNSWIVNIIKKIRYIFYQEINFIFSLIKIDQKSLLIFVNKTILLICILYLAFSFAYLIINGIKFKISALSEISRPNDDERINFKVIPNSIIDKKKSNK